MRRSIEEIKADIERLSDAMTTELIAVKMKYNPSFNKLADEVITSEINPSEIFELLAFLQYQHMKSANAMNAMDEASKATKQ